MQFIFEGQPFHYPRIQVRCVEQIFVATQLGFLQSRLGVANQVLSLLAVGREQRDPTAGPDGQFVPVDRERAAKRLEHIFLQCLRDLGIALQIRQCQREGVSADAGAA